MSRPTNAELQDRVARLEFDLTTANQDIERLTADKTDLQSRLAAAKEIAGKALEEASQTHEFEVAGKLHKVHHSDLVSVLQQVMELSEARGQANVSFGAQNKTLAEFNRNLMAARDRLEQQLKAIRTMSKVV